MLANDLLERPLLPPLLRGRATLAPRAPWEAALAGAEVGELGAGDLVYSTDEARMGLALVLEPEVSRAACAQMLPLAMAAFADAAGAVIPPEQAISFTWPGGLRLNGAQVGLARLLAGPCLGAGSPGGDGPPAWLVLGLSAQIAPRDAQAPGQRPDDTSFAEEGAGEVTTLDLIESCARHLTHWLHRWETEGFAPIQTHWWDRRDGAQPLAPGIPGRLSGIDAQGGALLSGPDRALSLWEALA